MTNTVKIGFIGLGNMGIPMACQLLKAGYPVLVYNRNKNKDEAVVTAGADKTSSAADVIKRADVVVIMVTDDAAIIEIFTGEHGLLTPSVTGKYIINMSTVSPEVSRQMAALCESAGNHYVDAPVSGSVKQAQEGQLVIMAGAEEIVFDAVKPILGAMGKLILRVGSTGAGNTVKLAINTLLAIQAQGLAETINFANQQGIKTEDLLTLVNNSAIGTVFGKIKGEAIIQENFKAAFALKNIAKDLRLAKDLGLNSPLANTAYTSFQQAEAKFGNEDIIAIVKALNKIA